MTDSLAPSRAVSASVARRQGGGTRQSTRATPLRLVAALVAGLLLWVSFPGHDVWPLAPVGVAVLTLVTRGVRLRSGALLGMVAGLGFFIPHLQWAGVYVGALPWFALAVTEAAYLALMGALLPLVWTSRGGVRVVAPAVGGLWVAQEALRGRFPFGGFPWGRLAFSQSDSPVLGLASVGGAPLMSFAVGLAGGLIAVGAVRLAASDRSATRVRFGALAALVAAVAVMAVGAVVPSATGRSGTVQVAAVQGNVPRAGLEFNAERRAVLDNHASATVGLAARIADGRSPQPDLVVWPENSSDIDPLRNQDARDVIADAVDAVGVPTLVGAVLQEPVGRLSNASIVWGPRVSKAGCPAWPDCSAGAGPGETYVKQHPAPFGEYIPYRSFFRLFSKKVDLVQKDFVAGDRSGLITLGPATLSDVICFEVAYDGIVRGPVQKGADLIVVQTNNATFGRTPESVQQLAMSKVRAVENGRSVVHISTVGVSAIFTPDGTAVATSGSFTQEVLEAKVPLRTQQTLATRVGAWPEAMLAALGLGLAGLGAEPGVRAAVGRRRGRTSGAAA